MHGVSQRRHVWECHDVHRHEATGWFNARDERFTIRRVALVADGLGRAAIRFSYAQLESEVAFIKSFFKNDPNKVAENTKLLYNTCFKCHGVMGKRRLDDDHGGPDKGDFDPSLVYGTYDNDNQAYVYGALARDGVSCMACHRIVEDKPSPNASDPFLDFLKNKINGNFTVGNPAELFGPFLDTEIVTDPMNNSLGIKPKHNAYIKSSRMCGNCHTINMPLMDNPDADPNKPHLEQVTYLEWLNSGYQNEVGTNSKAQTCQNCHMPTKYSNSKGTLNIPTDPTADRIYRRHSISADRQSLTR